MADLIPVNAKLLLDTAMGDRSYITEKNFSPEELQALKNAAILGQLRQRKAATEHQAVIDALRKMPANEAIQYTLVPDRRPDGELDFKKTNILTAAQEAVNRQKKLDRTNASVGTIQYEDYGPIEKRLDNTGWLETLKRSRNDPYFRMMTSLGRAKLEHDPEGNLIVRDEYSFHGEEPNITRPTQVLDALMARIIGKGAGRPVHINLGYQPLEE